MELVRIDERLVIVRTAERYAGRLDSLPERHEVVSGNPEDLVHVDWSESWRWNRIAHHQNSRSYKRLGLRANLKT
jgi:hypothetical protein